MHDWKRVCDRNFKKVSFVRELHVDGAIPFRLPSPFRMLGRSSRRSKLNFRAAPTRICVLVEGGFAVDFSTLTIAKANWFGTFALSILYQDEIY